MTDWVPEAIETGKPRYLAIADAIERDIASGRLASGEQLPPLRRLASRLGIDFTTVSRAYVEAQARRLVESHVGRGTFVADRMFAPSEGLGRKHIEDLSMNMPPDPVDSALLARMKSGLDCVSANLVDLLRYQAPTGTERDREAAATWFSGVGLRPSLDQIAVTPGAHATMAAILSIIAKPGDVILCERITYPGIRNIAARFGVTLVGLEMDECGVAPDELSDAIGKYRPKALYLNPTLQNPTTLTVPVERRQALANVLCDENLMLIEDDAYGFIPEKMVPPIACYAPGLTWYIGGLAKCIGAGLRLAFTIAPSPRLSFRLDQAVRALSGMSSPLSMALTTQWIEDGTADEIRHFIRAESAARQVIVREALEGAEFEAAEDAFNIWLTLPQGVGRADVVARLAGRKLGVMPSDAFTVSGEPGEKVRVSLGGSITREVLRENLYFLGNALAPNAFMG